MFFRQKRRRKFSLHLQSVRVCSDRQRARLRPPKGGLNKSRLTLRANAVPRASPISEEGNPIAQIGFVEANHIRDILDEKWQQEKACGEGGWQGGTAKHYTIKMHLTIERSQAVIV